MNKYVMVSFYNCNYQVKVNTLSNQIALEEKNLDTISEVLEDYSMVAVEKKIFLKFVEKLNLELPENLKNELEGAPREYVYLQNTYNQKLVIDQVNKEYMISKFISNTNEDEYIMVPDSIYDSLVVAVQDANYKKVAYNKNYFVSSKEVLEDVDKFMSEHMHYETIMFERCNYFDLDILTKKFNEFFNNKISKTQFGDFCYLMFTLANFYPANITEKEERIYYLLKDYFENLSFGIERISRSEVNITFGRIRIYCEKLMKFKK